MECSVNLGNWQFIILQTILHLTLGHPGLVLRCLVGKYTLLVAVVLMNEI